MLTKRGYCNECPQVMGEQWLIGGLCLYHYWGKKRTESYLSAGNFFFRGEWGNVLFNRNHRKKLSEYDKQEVEQLYGWFEYHDEHSPLVCENCGDQLPGFSKEVRWSHHAHILPKDIFRSVAAHTDNHLTLGGMFSKCGCHYAYDASWARAARMNIYPIILRKFLLFRQEIALTEQKFLPDFFCNLLNPINS